MIRLQATTSERAQDQRDSRESDRARQGYTYRLHSAKYIAIRRHFLIRQHRSRSTALSHRAHAMLREYALCRGPNGCSSDSYSCCETRHHASAETRRLSLPPQGSTLQQICSSPTWERSSRPARERLVQQLWSPGERLYVGHGRQAAGSSGPGVRYLVLGDDTA